jgi:DNA uptake protein ComE-like DNA-binding protein
VPERELERVRKTRLKASRGWMARMAAVEAELAATRRRLDEANERTLAAERRATQIETETRQEEEGEPVSLSSATFDDLRGLGLSVTQAKRVLDFRERLGGFDSVADLDHVPGFPKSLLTELKRELSA